MKVSMEQVKRVLERHERPKTDLSEAARLLDKDHRVSDQSKLIRKVRDEVMAMPEVRAELVAELKARIERGEYQVSSEDIVDSMIRRAIADRIE
ncbi:MAG: flagellar biosynthesis anti-sigma factor FlgM [Armatimonadetes bacterium]|nr:flagellar biosynthesis anti-sigma factor FlgM [Armatimonadota bacterium]NOG92578.1 flagellar biosynthesis anti-sigma factor FlgM [Armatimonadota bacterium]